MDGVNETFSSVEEAPVVEEFQVDDLLDLRGLPEPEKEKEEDDGVARGVVFVAFEKRESLNLLGISIPVNASPLYRSKKKKKRFLFSSTGLGF